MSIPTLLFRWWSDRPLRVKGLIVVLVPLITMLFSFLTAFLVDRERYQASLMVESSNAARFEIYKLLDSIGDTERAVDTYQVVRSENYLAPYRILPIMVSATQAAITASARENGFQGARLRRLEAAANTQVELYRHRVDAIDSDAPPAEIAALDRESEDAMERLNHDFRALDEDWRRLGEERSAHLAQIEGERLIADVGVVVISVLVGIGGVLLFSRGIARRVGCLRENADRLAEGTPLLPLPPGSDEIGMLASDLERAGALLKERGDAVAASLATIRKSEELYRALAHNFPNGSISMFDRDLRYLVADGQDLPEVGFSRAELEGHTIWEVLPEETADKIEPLFRLTLTGVAHESELLFNDRLYQLVFIPLKDESGRIYAGLLMTQNVSERRRQEAALRLARDEAERANRAKSVFLSRMSHELRTPLNAILGFSQVLEISELSAPHTECVRHVLKAGRHLLALVDEVLDLARVEAGELRLKPVAVRIDHLAQECIGFMSTMMEKRSITCRVDASPAFETPVWADKHRLRQVMLNLISNAVKYNREKGQVVLVCEPAVGGRVRFAVRDTGHGISAEGLKHLFVPFERLGQEYREVEGTGLGLVISRQLIEAMGGTLGADSTVGEGATFWIELPGVPAEEPEADAVLHVNGTMVRKDAGDAATVLYVEDNASNIGVVSTLISRMRPHWRFLSARSGPEGLRMAREHRPDCVLLDLQLPEMNGDLVLSELRADRSTSEVPVILVSADVMTYSRAALLALGATDHLPKPIELAQLLEKLDWYMAA